MGAGSNTSFSRFINLTKLVLLYCILQYRSPCFICVCALIMLLLTSSHMPRIEMYTTRPALLVQLNP